MRKYIVIVLMMGLFILDSGLGLLAKENSWEEIGKGYFDLRVVLVDRDNPGSIYIGANNTIFKTEDSGQTWRSIFSLRGQNNTVNFLLNDPQDKNALYAATGNGLFYSNNRGQYWKRIFGGRNYLENNCKTISVLPAAIYLGTRAGLFISKDKGRTWQRQQGGIGDSQILAITASLNTPNSIYVASPEAVFKTQDNGQTWMRIFSGNFLNNNQEPEETPQEQEETKVSDLRYLALDPNNPDYLFLATSRGIYKSKDGGKSWEPFTSYGLLSHDIKFILISDRADLYAMTKSAIFEYKSERWQEISLELAASQINFISLDNRYNLYAACDNGLFKTKAQDTPEIKNDTLTLYLEGEPDIRKVQEVAIEYAEVHPDKIKAWRKQASKRALLPRLTLGMNQDKDRTISSSIWGTYGSNSSPGKYFVGPDDETRYNNKNWSVSLTWELGDLIWNNDQTLIDVRSKLMAELRGNILDEVTRIYFERLRLKMELDSLRIEDRKKRFEKELRLKELAASLDALTGGYFSASKSSPGLEPVYKTGG